ncbi:MAG: hypothetical protein ACFE8E_11870 [Candidatus Hodarchaeota archaeon]
MVGISYFYINLIINLYILIAVYYYCIKIYGIKATIITNLSLSSLVLILIFTSTYGIADLGTDYPFFILKVGEFEINTDVITIFTVFVVVFELARYSLKKSKGTDLSIKDIIVVSIVVSLYGILFQLLMDPTAAAIGLYYYQNPPEINIFGYPIWFITSFAIYGLYAFIFLLIERFYFLKSSKHL